MIFKRYQFTLLWFFLSIYTKVECKVIPKSSPRLTFSRISVAYLSGNQKSQFSGNENLGNGVGFEGLLNPLYNYKDINDNDDNIAIGWSYNTRLGWNFTKNRVCSFGEDIGFWGAKMIGPNIEVGIQYSFLGYGVYQKLSFWGSKIQGAVRWKNLQFTYIREGAGAFYGCIKTKNSPYMSNIHGLELTYLTNKRIFSSLRRVYYSFGKDKISETQINIGITFL
jgi:hypothetical protein